MGILEELEKMDKQGINSDTVSIDADNTEDKEDQQATLEPDKEPEPEPEPNPETTPKAHDPEDYYKQREMKRMRAEMEDLRAQNAAYAAQQAALMQQHQSKKDVAPDPSEDPDAYRDYWNRKNAENVQALSENMKRLEADRMLSNAKQELSHIERSYAASNEHYDEVVSKGFEKLKKIAKLENPELDDFAIQSRIDNAKVTMAAQAVKRGQNPAEALYNYMTEAFDIKPASKESKVDESKTFDAVKRNKAKSASPVAGGGQGGEAVKGREAAKNMTLREFAALDNDEKSRIFM